jgi:hypothetical protein
MACSGGGGGIIGPGGSNGPTGNGPTGETPGENANPDGTSPDGTTIPKSITAKLAGDMEISEVAVFQAVKGSIAQDGKAATPGVPLIAMRDAYVRVYVKPTDDYSQRSLKAVLRVVDEDGKPVKALTDEKTMKGDSSEATLSSTFNFRVQGQYLPLGAQISVAITDDDAKPIDDGTDSPARYPTDGTLVDLGLQNAGPSVKVVVVPIKYTADGSGRLPDTSQTQLDIDHDAMWSQYPIPDVDISVHNPVAWSHTVAGNGTGWDQLLEAMINLREQDGVDDDVYYWAPFNAASSSNAFCGGGCVAGLSSLASDPRDAYFRVSIGMGFSGKESAMTMVHEIGHAHGRNHAPCSDFGSIDGVDPRFPYSNGGIHAWGMNLVDEKLMNPSTYADFMGYCDPSWVSDYTYKALYERIAIVNKGLKPAPPAQPSPGNSGSSNKPGSFQFIRIGADGPTSFGQHVDIRTPPKGESREVTLVDVHGKALRTVRGSFAPFDHLPGGLLLVPEVGVNYAGLRVAGYSRTIMR